MPALFGRTPFVGRVSELAGLCEGLDAACRGEGAVLLLAGEPGIGKTRLLEETALRAQERGLRVLWGRCYEGEGAPAFWPWTQILRVTLQDPDAAPLLSALGPGAADIAQLLPELQPSGTDPPPSIPDPAQARFRLFESVTSFLVRAASARPLMLVLDDLHWADLPSLHLLRYLVGATRNTPLMIAGTYRDMEVDRGHPLAETLAGLAREPHAGRIALGRLSEEEATRFIALTAGASLPEAARAAITQTAEGNPFFLAETVRLLSSEPTPPLHSQGTEIGTVIPQSVRDVIGRRLDRLSPRCNQTLTIAAVIGRDFSLSTLERAGDLSGDPLLEALEEAEAAQLVALVPQSADRFRFTHALIRETLYDELPSTRRIRLHRQVGAAMETLAARDPGTRLAELAHHFTQAAAAGEGERAVAYSHRAGDHALTVFAYEEAVSHYERALRVLDAQPADTRERCALLLALGDAQQRAGEVTAARETLERSAAIARRLDAPDLLARAALGYGGAAPEVGLVNERLIQLIDEALAAVGEGDSALRARLLARQAMELYHGGPREERDALSAAALAMARRLGDPATLAFALNARYQALWEPENLAERLAVCEELLAMAGRARDPEMALMGHALRVPVLLEFGDIEAVRQEIVTHTRLAAESRQPFHLWHAERLRTLHAYLDGRLDDMEEHARRALAVAEGGQIRGADVLFVSHMQFLRRDQGRMPELESPIKDIMGRYPRLAPGWRCPMVNVYATAGRLAEARRELDDLAAGDFTAVSPPMVALGVFALSTDGIAIVGHRRAAEIVAARLRPYADRYLVNGATPNFYGCCAHYLGVLVGVMGHWDEAVHHLETALAMNARTGVPQLLARTRCELAAALAARARPEDRARAAELANEALTTARQLGMQGVAQRMEAMRATLERPMSPAYPDGLTSREVEVLRLLASGMSNREIAETLVVTINTVERHLVSVYGKLGVKGRAAATAYAHRHGLT